MQNRRKEERRSDWWLTMEQMGREFRTLYPPAETPSDLHALFREERRRSRAMHQKNEGDDSKDDGS